MSAAEGLGGQFKKFTYLVKADPNRTDVVVAHVSESGVHKPIGSLGIRHDDMDDMENNEYEQQIINDELARHRYEITEEQSGQLPGQMRWAGGHMNPIDPSHVDWIGLDLETAPPSVLARMMSIGVRHHGKLPHADFSLSQHGERIARGMARKYGMKGHPRNPDMQRTFNYSPYGASSIARQGAGYTWDKLTDLEDLHPGSTVSYDDEEAAKIHREVDASLRLAHKPPRPEKKYDNPVDRWLEEPAPRNVRGQMTIPGFEAVQRPRFEG